MTFDPDKPVMTREGFPARILCTDRDHNGGPIVALVRNNAGRETVRCYSAEGSYFAIPNSRGFDLINTPEKGYVNIWVERDGGKTQVNCSNTIRRTAEEAEKLAAFFPEEKYLYIALEVELPND